MAHVSDRFHSRVHGIAYLSNVFACRSFLFGGKGCHLSAVCLSAMAPCVDVVLSSAIGGGEVRRWQSVPLDSFLDDVGLSEDYLESFPGKVEVVHGQKKLRRPLHIELRSMGSDEGHLFLGLVRTQAFKDDVCDLIAYISTDRVNAVKIPELGVRFTFPKGEHERFSHGFAAMCKQFQKEPQTHIGRQVVELMRRELPGCVLRRKVGRFFCDVNGENSPLAIECVLVLDATGDMLLRMDTCWFTMTDDEATAEEVRAAVNEIYHATFF